MYEVRVEAGFAAAHFLRDYHGKCENLHGHNYKVFAHLRGTALDSGGMLLDFAVLKAALRDTLKKLDHTNLNDMECFGQNPSAEKIARFIYDEVLAQLGQKGCDLAYDKEKCGGENGRAFLWAVDVFETDTSRARFAVC